MKSSFPELNYDKLVDNAFIGVVRDALSYVEKYGLPSNHYFYITLKTKFRGVSLPEFLLQKYPDTITIVLQYEFSNLHVSEKEFGVTLSFNGQNYYIRVPFKSILAFTDPGVNFSLQFNVPDIYGEDFFEEDNEPSLPYVDGWHNESLKILKKNDEEQQEDKEQKQKGKESSDDESDKIISIDKFRK